MKVPSVASSGVPWWVGLVFHTMTFARSGDFFAVMDEAVKDGCGGGGIVVEGVKPVLVGGVWRR